MRFWWARSLRLKVCVWSISLEKKILPLYALRGGKRTIEMIFLDSVEGEIVEFRNEPPFLLLCVLFLITYVLPAANNTLLSSLALSPSLFSRPLLHLLSSFFSIRLPSRGCSVTTRAVEFRWRTLRHYLFNWEFACGGRRQRAEIRASYHLKTLNPVCVRANWKRVQKCERRRRGTL